MCAHYQAPNGERLRPEELSFRWDGRVEETVEHVRPTNYAPILYRRDGEELLGFFHWMLIPFWAREFDRRKFGANFNARAETLDTLPSFRAPFRQRRCLIPALGWYEWPEKRKSLVTAADGGMLMLAGLWDVWDRDPSRGPLYSYTMVMTAAAPGLEWVHHRSPVVLDEAAQRTWLDPDADPAACKALLGHGPEPDEVRVEPVA